MKFEKFVVKVPGKKSKEIFLFTLSTCIWCKKTKALIKELGLGYSYIDVDLLGEEEQEEASKKMNSLGKGEGFPMIIINENQVIRGFNEEEIRKLVK